ncbi:MAG: deoxyribose-phosphate aldolase [Eubacteriales bacterium]|nr:deoxyribose-phosphate aldolase [Eubacteriales bacterium]
MNSAEITKEQLAGMLDHTNLKAFASRQDFETLCGEAAQIHAAMVAVNPAPVALCRELLRGSGVRVGAAISFPLGQNTIAQKAAEARQAIADGAQEIDYVIQIGRLKDGDDAYIREEMEEMVRVCREGSAICKVIFENCYLTKEEIQRATAIAGEVRPDFIKTSTGFGTSGAKAEDVRLMKETVGNAVKVKAAGGIRDWKTCAAMIDAGAERIGTSSSLKILREFKEERYI